MVLIILTTITFLVAIGLWFEMTNLRDESMILQSRVNALEERVKMLEDRKENEFLRRPF